MKELNLQPLTGRLRSVRKRPLFTSPLGAFPLLCGLTYLSSSIFQFRMIGIVALNPTGGAVPLTLKVHEVPRGTANLAGDAMPEAVKLRHDSRYALE